MLRAVAPIWLLQLPWLSTTEERETLRRELAGVSPDRMLREMGQFLDRYTERRPLLLVTIIGSQAGAMPVVAKADPS
jgi:hypothetical protein